MFLWKDGSYTGSFNEIDIASNSLDLENLKEKLVKRTCGIC